MAKWIKKRKSAPYDYSVSMLPTTRKAVFWDVLKLNYGKFLYYGLLILLFSMPLHVMTFIEQVQLTRLINSQVFEGQQLAQELYGLKNLFALLRIPCFLILSVGIAGFSKVIRKYAWVENVYFNADFSSGIKENVGQMLLIGAMVGGGYAICQVLYNMASFSDDGTMSFISLIPIVIIALVGVPTVAYAVVCISIYKNKFGKMLQIGWLLTVSKPFQTYLALLCCLAIVILQFLPFTILMVVGRILSSMLSPIIFLGWYLFALNLLDEKVNKKNFPQIVGKGIKWETEQD